MLPSRYRVPFDDAVVDLARRAGRPVVTTHGGPAHLVRHEENGIITYDNPGSMVWALDRILGDPGHAEQHGPERQARRERQRQLGRGGPPLPRAVRRRFPELTETRAGHDASERRSVTLASRATSEALHGRLSTNAHGANAWNR